MQGFGDEKLGFRSLLAPCYLGPLRQVIIVSGPHFPTHKMLIDGKGPLHGLNKLVICTNVGPLCSAFLRAWRDGEGALDQKMKAPQSFIIP